MKGISQKLKPLQNESMVDRIIRGVVGAGLLSYVYIMGVIGMWAAIGFLVGIYLVTTALIGMDGIYRALGVRTCGGSERNQCGTFPYQVDAAMHKEVHPEPGYEDKPSESVAVHKPEHRSRHAQAMK